MPMHYDHEFMPAAALPRARLPLLQHLVDTYASETSKTAAVWSELTDAQLEFRPHAPQQLGAPDPGAPAPLRASLLRGVHRARRAAVETAAARRARRPASAAYVERLVALARPRLAALADGDEAFWLAEVPFFDVRRAAHLGVLAPRAPYRPSPGPGGRLPSGCWRTACRPTYGPTADVTWAGADPTTTLDAARRRGA